MKENTQEKSLVQINENSIFYKIKKFFRNLFYKTNPKELINIAKTTTINNNESNKISFMEEIRKIEDEETILLKLQKKYRSGKIKGEELNENQILSLGRLYDKQIAELRKYNEIEKQKLLEYRRKLQTEN